MKNNRFFSAVIFTAVLLSSAIVMSCSFRPGEISGYALFYAVEQRYVDAGITNLNYTVDDAQAMAALFASKGYDVTIRTETNATLANFYADMANYSTVVNPQDIFVFYFSGHGGGIPDSVYSSDPLSEMGDGLYRESLILYTTETQVIDWVNNADYEHLDVVALMDYVLLSEMQKINTKNKIAIIDACKSGGFVDNDQTTDMVSPSFIHQPFPFAGRMGSAFEDYFSEDALNDTTIYLTASGELENSLEDSLAGTINHGFFTYYFTEYYNQADLNYDSCITAYEMYNIVSEGIVRFLNTALVEDGNPELRYHPHITGNGRDFALFLLD